MTAVKKATTKPADTTTTVATATTEAPHFQILDEEPVFERAQGRSKSALRVAMEQLPVGKSLVASEESTAALLNNCRQKAQEIRSAGKQNGEDIKFSVRTDVQGRIIVTRKS